MKISKKYMKMIEVYDCFRMDNNPKLEYDQTALEKMYVYESRGVLDDMTLNGYYWSKHNMDLTLKMWKQDIAEKYISKSELLNDSKFPQWWIQKMLETM